MLRSVDPYQLRTLSHDDALDLRMECERFSPETTGAAAHTLTRLKELTTIALSSRDVQLQVVGD